MTGEPVGPVELPMFPLGSVLLPSTAISLHVFEERYRAWPAGAWPPTGGSASC